MAEILYKEIITRYGVFSSIVSDQARSFKNCLIEQLCKLLKIKHVFSSPYRPESTGQAERCNHMVIKSRRLLCKKQEEWLQYIPAVLYSYRATATVPTHMSPYRILFGREMRTPIDVALMNEWESPDVEQFTKELIPKLKLTQEISKQNLHVAESNVRAKSFYDRGTTDAKFALGPKVVT